MNFEELVPALNNLSVTEQRRLITEVLPKIWPQVCLDDGCFAKVKELMDEAAVDRAYKIRPVDHI